MINHEFGDESGGTTLEENYINPEIKVNRFTFSSECDRVQRLFEEADRKQKGDGRL